MTTIKTSIRIAVAVMLVLAMVLATLYVPSAQESSLSHAGATAAYADETTPGAVTPGAVEAPEDISLAQIAPIDDIVYNGKTKKPSPKVTFGGKSLKKGVDFTVSYKNNKLPGKATLTIKGKAPDYTGTQQFTFNIIVETPKSFKLKATTDSVDASWKKASGKVTGYQIQYAEDAKFTKTRKTKTLTSQKTTKYSIDRPYYKRSYHVKVRTYVKVGKKNYYSAYTAVKMKTTKAASWFKSASKNIGKNTKWIETDLSKQVVYLHKGTKIVKTYAVSTGKPGTPTIRGTFRLYKKIQLHDMIGIDPNTGKQIYRTPNVPWSSYFKAGYAFHGAYWNPQVNIPLGEKRTPRSHGCVNMRIKDAKYLYNYAPIGTLVIVHK
ncbi:MAG: L,D-transpeptidase [Clostridiales Family XIII bacterium]|jgi:lipoprotein-anchoring transpeptidase ErfK/SrfK|nr:L,D-transpeptidase [Clostridiales Family XIII bacterium]